MKDFLKQKLEIHCQCTDSTGNVKERSLGSRIMIPDRILDLYREMKNTLYEINKGKIKLNSSYF